MPVPKIILFAFLAVGLSSCGSKLEGLTDEDLQDKMYECQANTSQSPGFAISCDNFRRECTRRRDDGRFVC